MCIKTKTFITDTVNPYLNLAIEEYLLHEVKDGECILYLWQNRHTVVIGRNQNCWKDCKVNELEEDGGYLARRLSGGGAVYHDLGNLNFTFLAGKEDYNLEKQLRVIQNAVASFGLFVEKTGRNDLTVNGRKFSGNAFYEEKGKCYHHGTILIDSDVGQMSRFLNVSKEKLESKGVSSVRARVGNLSDLCSDITVETMKEQLLKAFAGEYGGEPAAVNSRQMDWKQIKEYEDRNGSWDWKYGRKIPFTHSFSSGRYPWGSLEFQMQVDKGVIRECTVYSDGLEERIGQLGPVLEGCLYNRRNILDMVDAEMKKLNFAYEMQKDILRFLQENLE